MIAEMTPEKTRKDIHKINLFAEVIKQKIENLLFDDKAALVMFAKADEEGKQKMDSDLCLESYIKRYNYIIKKLNLDDLYKNQKRKDNDNNEKMGLGNPVKDEKLGLIEDTLNDIDIRIKYEKKEEGENKNEQKPQPKKKKDKEDYEDLIYTSLIIRENLIAEQVYDEFKGVSRFCVYYPSENEFEYKSMIFEGDVVYQPIQDEEVQEKAILLPSEPLEYGSDEKLNSEIKAFIYKWLDIPNEFLQFAVWNIKRSWVFEKFHTLNYLRALGDTGQGKTRFLDTLGYLHYKPIATSGATTPAPIFRLIKKWKGTLIMDEADFKKSDESQDIIKIINLGYEQGKSIIRCDQNDADKIKFFDPFCPKILATRKMFEDKATESRCITQIMKGTLRKDINFNLNNAFKERALELRNKLLLWRFRNYFKIDSDAEIDFELGDLEPRVKQIVNSFITLFNSDGEQMEKFKVFIHSYQKDLIQERQNSFSGQIIGAIVSLIEKGNVNISASDIITEGELTTYNNKEMKPRGLTNPLKSLGLKIAEKPIKVDGKAKKILIIDDAQLENLCKRYGYQVTKVTLHKESLVNGNQSIKQHNLLDVGANSNNGNNSNSVTQEAWKILKEILPEEAKEPISIKDLKKKRFGALSDVVFDNLIKKVFVEGMAFEPTLGFIQVLE